MNQFGANLVESLVAMLDGQQLDPVKARKQRIRSRLTGENEKSMLDYLIIGMRQGQTKKQEPEQPETLVGGLIKAIETGDWGQK